MRLIEVLLRLGCGFVAWMVLYAYYLWLGVVGKTGCDVSGDEMYRLLLGMVPLAVGFAFLLRSTRPLKEIHNIMRWGSVPLFLLLPFTLLSVWPILTRVTLGDEGICGSTPDSPWETWWAPVQLVTLALTIVLAGRVWLKSVVKQNS